MYKVIIIAIFSLFCLPSQAADSDKDELKYINFWQKLYDKDYETFYCGIEKKAGRKVAVGQVYPSSWIADAVGCKNTKECKSDKYRQASSDLHNLWPVLKKFNASRGDLKFGEIEGNKPRFKTPKCDFERSSGKNAVVEPRDEIKGQIARSYLYMIHWYDLPTHDLLPLMIKWNKKYPPTDAERKRQLWIEEYQDKVNEFIKEY